MPESPPADAAFDLEKMIGHREFVQAADTLEAVHKRFTSHEFEFMAVLDGENFLGLCSRQDAGMLLGARFGFAIHSRRAVQEILLKETTCLKVNQPLAEVLKAVSSRSDVSLYDDVALLDEAGRLRGLIFSRTLVRLQNTLLLEKIGQLEEKQREINEKNEQLEGDLRVAREIQLAMLPNQYPSVSVNGQDAGDALRFYHHYHPAGVVSGDFFHIMKISAHSVGIFICDVMGHGVRSAFVTAMLRALVEELRTLGDNPGALLTRVNAELKSILRPLDSTMFATAFYLVADVAGGVIRYSKAGHPNPLILQRRTGEVKSLVCPKTAQGPALGMFDDIHYGSCEAPLEAENLILLFTDGLYEVFDANEIEFGLERLAPALEKRCGQSLDIMVEGLVADVRHYAADAEFEDDVCLVAVEAMRTGR